MKPDLRILLSPRRIWARSNGIVRLLLYLAGVEAFLYLVQRVFQILRWPKAAGTLNVWLVSIALICILLASFVVFRWLRKKLMWRLRNRLIVTYVFIGVIPVLLLFAMGVIAGELLTGQFASFLATSDIQHRIDSLESANSALAQTLANRLSQGASTSSLAALPPTRRFPRRTVTVWYKGAPAVLAAPGAERATTPTRLPPGNAGDVQGIVEDQGELYLRASRSLQIGSNTLTVISSVPFDAALLQDVTAGLGAVMVSKSADLALVKGSSGPIADKNQTALRSGIRPAPTSRFDVPVDFAAPVAFIDWQTGKEREGLLAVSTRPSLLFDRLFANLGSNANAILVALGAIALMLALIELLALIVGIRLTRTMTRSVHGLYAATQHINRGDFTYRIEVKNQDQLAELESSFNSMSISLEALIAEQKEKQRMESELAIAHEVQEQLFPREGAQLNSLEVHGLCRPARSVSGDYYDFLPLGDGNLGLAIGDISGKGISAALMMATIHSAIRVYEIGRVPAGERIAAAGCAGVSPANDSTLLMPARITQSPAGVLGLLNGHLFHSTPAEKYATMFFGLWYGNRRVLRYCNAGHLPPLIVRQNGAVEQLTAGGTVVGLFEQVSFEEASVQLAPGDLLVAYSDGLTEPENEFGEFGQDRVIELVRGSRHLPLSRISEAVSNAVVDWIGAAEQPDDITLVLARAK